MDRTELIKILIENTGLNLKAFAQKSDLPYSTLRSMLERGIGNASVNNVLKICKTLGITIEELEEMAEKNITVPLKPNLEQPNKNLNPVIDTLAAHFEGKNITPKKMKLIEQYIDALFQDDEE
ncbi:helix-turn-helix domain-containing protein [Clostridium tunisiense]|uniref:helix-turn-helix domain-containing protein n=1 Tax=Clostridium tunisiense TaxID=219748 RepID=UPI0002E4C47F|nr:helix-turn-helix transcriptional regulator [Clostridium tunisiense]